MRRRVVLMEHENGHLGAIGLAEKGGSALIHSYDSRCGIKTAQAIVPACDGDPVVNANIQRSIERGWVPFYDGAPLNG